MIVPDELRGRVLSLYMLDRGFMPLGALFAGTSAHFLGAPDDRRHHGRHRHRPHRPGRLAHPGDSQAGIVTNYVQADQKVQIVQAVFTEPLGSRPESDSGNVLNELNEIFYICSSLTNKCIDVDRVNFSA